MKRFLADDVPNPRIMRMRNSYDLLGMEMAVQEIERQIESKAVFFDPYINGLFPMSLRERVLPLLDGGTSPGYMRPENVVRFLGMVHGADQRLPSGEETNGEMADHFRRRRQELMEFLERAVKLGEPVWCDL